MSRTHRGCDGVVADGIHADLAEEGAPVGRNRVARLIARMDLAGVRRRWGFRTAVRDCDVHPAIDLVEGQLTT